MYHYHKCLGSQAHSDISEMTSAKLTKHSKDQLWI